MPGTGLVPRAVDVSGPLRWRWLLSDADSGVPLADHQVDLDPDSGELAAFGDLYEYVRSYAAPDRRAADESRIVTRVGAWAGRELLGEQVGAAIAGAARSGPVTVRVVVPAELDPVLTWPLELAHANGKPLAALGDAPFVYDLIPALDGSRRPKAEVAGALRVLAVFSQPSETTVLALRRERYALSRLIRRIAARQRRMVELQVLQYGVTRDRLAEIADTGDGWDVLHLSGHGGRGLFLLEHADGSTDPVDTADLIRMLRPARPRVKLAVVSACESAADATAETLRLIGLDDQAERLEQDAAQARPGYELMGVARALVLELGCAVVAMRYPVTDDFAIAFGDEMYERLLSRGQPADVAAARAAAEAASGPPSAARPALSLTTPGVFGTSAAGLKLPLPRGVPTMDPAEAAMGYFPAEPERFVGRAQAMARASTALAPESGHTTVVLHGMAGACKTACALELAYRHHDGFAAAAFWQAPAKDDEFTAALASLAAALEMQLGGYGFTMTAHITDTAPLEAFLPRLRQVLKDNGLLLVLDNLETLLTPDGSWRDPRWGPLMTALTSHGGESRLILASRIPLAGLGGEALVLPVHALSLEEAAALARELPNLRNRLHAGYRFTHARTDTDVIGDRARVRRVLRIMQGHPKLLELADAAAADQDQLDAQLAVAEQAVAGEHLDAFFRDGASSLDPEQFLIALSTWTRTAVTVLPQAARLLAEFLSCVEEDDRSTPVIDGTWGNLWHRLDRSGDPPDPGPLLEMLAAAALVQPDPPPDASGRPPADHAAAATFRCRMHPGVAAAIHAAAPPEFRDIIDTELAEFWQSVALAAEQRDGEENSAVVVHAGLAAAPYLLRRHDWNTASTLLEHAVVRDESPGVVQAVLPALRHIAAATDAPRDYFVLARALVTVDPAEAERLLRDSLRAAINNNDYWLASVIAGDLVILLRDTGRLDGALDLAGEKIGYTSQAGLGPWTQLADQAQRLEILAMLGKHEQVLAEIAALRIRMDEQPARPVGNEAVHPWTAREGILDISRNSAMALGQWQQCLDLNAEITASKQQRGAGIHEITCTRYSDAGPLIGLGQLEAAGVLLSECQQVFEEHADITNLARVLSTRAHLEGELGHQEAAVDFERTAIRLRYTRPVPGDIAASHDSLAFRMRAMRADPAEQRAHRLAAALIFQLTGMTHNIAGTRRVLADELHQHDTAGAGRLPGTLTGVVQMAELTDGVRLGELITALQPDAEAAEAALAWVLDKAADLPPHDGIARHLERWDPVITAVAAACQGDQDAAAELGPFLDEQAKQPDWAALVAVLRRILGGERGEGLLDGLDPVDTAIAGQILTRLAGGEQEPC